MKLTHYLIPAALLAATSISGAATISTKINDFATARGASGGVVTGSTTNDYVFTDGVGSITLRAELITTNNGVDGGALTSLDSAVINVGAGTRFGNSADSASDTVNHFTSAGAGNREGFRVTISLLNSTNVDTSTIAFSFDSLGVRGFTNNGGAEVTWQSSATTTAKDFNPSTANPANALSALDTSTYGDIANNPYTGTFAFKTVNSGQYLQLSDVVPGGNGIVMTANFTSVPEPSSAALLGLGGLALILRRRK